MTLTEWYKHAVFANLAYVEWSLPKTLSAKHLAEAALDAERLTSAASKSLFAENGWSIPSFYANDEGGFAANVFSRGSEAVLAIRGTEASLIEALPFVGETGLVDLYGADVGDIGLLGMAIEQAVSLVNYVNQLIAPAGEPGVVQLALRSDVVPLQGEFHGGEPFVAIQVPEATQYYWLETVGTTQGLGVLPGDGSASVTGHSLGGHLAALAIRLFPGVFQDAVTFNAAGFDPPTSLALTDEFIALFLPYLPEAPADSFGQLGSRLTAIESEDSSPADDVSLVASGLTGQVAGVETFVQVEMNSHSMDQLMDALAVHSLLWTLNPDLAVDTLFSLYDGMSAVPGGTEEALVTSLSRALLGEAPDLETFEAGLVSAGEFESRTTQHEVILRIREFIADNPVTLEPIWHLSPTVLAGRAAVDPAYQHALQWLDPFVIAPPPTDAGQFLASNTGRSGEYWLARAEMLVAAFSQGSGDLEAGPGLTPGYVDLALDRVVVVPGDVAPDPSLVTFIGDSGTGEGVMLGGEGADRIFGGAGADQISGGAGSDFIDGGKGIDILYGSAMGETDDGVPDLLHGGDGMDFYYVGNGDVVMDADRGVAGIMLGGYSMSVEYLWIEGETYQSADGLRSLFVDGANAILSLALDTGTVSFLIQDFLYGTEVYENGDFSIELVGGVEDDPGGTGYSLVGTPGNDTTTEGVLLNGTAGDDAIAGLEGNDLITTGAGADLADGGTGDDVLRTGVRLVDPDADRFFGGPGNDALSSGGGPDQLLGGDGDDYLQSGPGADIVDGGAGDDALAGGYGDDVIYGNSGDDFILADKGLVEFSPTSWWLGLSGVSLLAAASFEAPGTAGYPGADRVWGGAGDDRIEAGAGSDFADGGSGNDRVFGNEGDDEVRGGAGDDFLRGDDGADLILGDGGDDVMFGGSGGDVLYGGSGDDRLSGGAGADVLAGGAGSDTYNFDEGEGWDTILEDYLVPASDWNVINMPLGHSIWDYTYTTAGADLLISSLLDDEGIIVDGWVSGQGAMIGEVRFSDGVLSATDILDLSLGVGTRFDDFLYGGDEDDSLEGAGGDDVLLGESGNDHLLGGPGDDELAGGGGDDWLEGGAGSDYLDGGPGHDVLVAGAGGSGESESLFGAEGSDSYIVSSDSASRIFVRDIDADGNDWDALWLTGGLTPEDIMVTRPIASGPGSETLTFSFAASDGSREVAVNVLGWFGNGQGALEELVFDSVTIQAGEFVASRLNVATQGRDFLSGSAGEVLLRGFAGDDVLQGAGDSNVLLGDDGDDTLSATGLDNLLYGGAGDDQLVVMGMAAGATPLFNVLDGGAGRDRLEGPGDTGTVWMDGGRGADSILVGADSLVLVAPGPGFDRITMENSSASVLLMINDDEQGDVVLSSDAWGRAYGVTQPVDSVHVVSFGGGASLDDLTLTKEGDDLILRTGAFDGLRFVDYLGGESGESSWITALQFIDQASASWEAGDHGQGAVVSIVDFAPVLLDFLAQELPDGAVYRIDDDELLAVSLSAGLGAYGGQLVYEYGLLGDAFHAHGTSVSRPGLQSLLDGGPLQPVSMVDTVPEQDRDLDPGVARVGEEFALVIPPDWIVEPFSGTSLPVTLASGLPLWLELDAGSGILSGTPAPTDVGDFLLSFSAVNALGQARTFTLSLSVEQGGRELGIDLVGSDSGDRLVGTNGDDRVDGGPGRDRISGGGGDDWLAGGPGDDRVDGGTGDDTLVANGGRDRLAGGTGNDTYVVEPGFGSTTIRESGGEDVLDLSLVAGIGELDFWRRGESLMVSVDDVGEAIRISGYFRDEERQVESIVLTDGVIDLEHQVQQLVQHRVPGVSRLDGGAAEMNSGANSFHMFNDHDAAMGDEFERWVASG